MEIKIAVLLFVLELGPRDETIAYDKFLGGLKRDELEELLRIHSRFKPFQKPSLWAQASGGEFYG